MRLPDAHPEKTYLGRQLRTDREDYVYDMKEKPVKNLLSGNKNAAPAEKKEAKGKGGSSGRKTMETQQHLCYPKRKQRPLQEGQRKRKGETYEP